MSARALRVRGLSSLPRRDGADKCDPVELLVDITYVLALSMAVTLMSRQPGMGGVLQAVSVLLAVVGLWQYSVTVVTIISVKSALPKLLMILQTGLFLALAITLPEAFTDQSGGLNGPVVFALMLTLNAVCGLAQWTLVAVGQPTLYRNVAVVQAGYVLLAAAAWASLAAHGAAKAVWILLGVLAFYGLASFTNMPIYDRFGIGQTEQWHQFGLRAFGERYAASYTVACCLSLELLEQAGQAGRLSAGLVVLVLAALLIAYLLLQLYAPLVHAAYRRLDPSLGEATVGQAQAQIFSYFLGHSLMCGGLAVSAGALSSVFTDLASSSSRFGPPIGTTALVELYGGVACCLLGQAMFSSTTRWRLDGLPLGGAAVVGALPVLLVGCPALLAVLVLLAVCAVLLRLTRRSAARAARRSAVGIPRRWRPVVRFNKRGHELSGFELMFDVMAAFAFCQTDVLVLRDPSAEGALRGLLVLAMLWGLWMSFVWAANTADADAGTIRTLHIVALGGLVFLGLALPRAFIEPGFNARVMVFLAAYLITRWASACALWVIQGRTAGYRPLLVIAASVATATLIGASTQMPQRLRVGLWLAALACEAIAAYSFTRRWWVAAPSHIAERFAFIVIIGLDMSLGGMAFQLGGAPIGTPQMILVALALVSVTVMWWLYFSLLQPNAEHRLTQTDPAVQRRVHNRLAYGYFNVAHLVVLAGMVAFGFGLRAIARDLGAAPTAVWGPRLPGLGAIALGVGLAVFAVGITAMWALQGHRPRAGVLAVTVASLALIPFAVHRACLPALAGFVGLSLALLAAEARSPLRRAATGTQTDNGPDENAPSAQPTALASFEVLDADGDGVITWRDFTLQLHRIQSDSATTDPTLVHRTEVAYRALWTAIGQAMDTDRGRVITRAEYTAYLARPDLGLSAGVPQPQTPADAADRSATETR
ncbi:low temperature requirement protein A [Streptomyces sp. NPDC054849]